MNILVVCHYGLYEDLTCSFVHSQVREYARLGHQVRVIIPIAFLKQGNNKCQLAPILRKQKVDGVSLYFLRYLSISHYGKKYFNVNSVILSLYFNLGNILNGFVPDVIHAHTLGLDSRLGGWLKKKLGCPLVVTTHGSDTRIPLDQGKKKYLKECCDEANAVVAVSSILAQQLKLCKTEVDVSAIINGFNFNNISEVISKKPFSLLQVSSLIKQKKVDVTIQAFAQILNTYPTATLTIIGEGPERIALETLCGQLGVKSSVHFLGQLPNKDVLQEMSKAQFFVMPSIKEGFGIVYLEAMASRCCTIGTEGEGISDVILSGRNGFLVPPNDIKAIVSVIENCLVSPDLFSKITIRGKKTADSFNWKYNAQQYISLFHSLDKGKRDNGTMDFKVER